MVIEGLYIGNQAAIENVERLKMLVSETNQSNHCVTVEHIPRARSGIPATD